MNTSLVMIVLAWVGWFVTFPGSFVVVSQLKASYGAHGEHGSNGEHLQLETINPQEKPGLLPDSKSASTATDNCLRIPISPLFNSIASENGDTSLFSCVILKTASSWSSSWVMWLTEKQGHWESKPLCPQQRCHLSGVGPDFPPSSKEGNYCVPPFSQHHMFGNFGNLFLLTSKTLASEPQQSVFHFIPALQWQPERHKFLPWR